ncbi:MAG: helix-turn-helix domain-containing protein [Candidatus Gastranaerophilales bacterium]|nr:helix-turn-helix domain-containing protein [Candidatus Gastranaerophilales bacterium]
MDKKLLKKVAKRIKSLRKDFKYTQDDLSYHSEIARSTIGNIETAQNDVTLTKLNKIAKAFNLSLSEFLNFDN